MEENLKPDTWKKILNFTVELIKLVIATFFGASAAINIF